MNIRRNIFSCVNWPLMDNKGIIYSLFFGYDEHGKFCFGFVLRCLLNKFLNYLFALRRCYGSCSGNL